ncbi:MAG: tetratricopeptide repeat protein [Oceanicaulis sp.]
MRPFRPIVFVASATLLAASPVHAGEVKDVLILPNGAVFVALRETPGGVAAEPQPGRLSVTVSGWSAAPRLIAPYGGAGFSALRVTDDGFVLEGGFASAEAELREGGVLIHFGAPAASWSNTALARSGQTASTPEPRFFAAGAAEPADTTGAEPAPEENRTDSASESPPETALRDRAASLPAPDRPAPSAPEAASPAVASPSVVAGPCDAQAAALADAPWDLDLIVAQADCLAEIGERANAAGLYERVLAFQPEHFRAALGLARLRQEAGRHDDAARLFETAAGSALTDGQALAAQAAARRAREAGGN